MGDFSRIANSWWMYMFGVFVVIFILVGSIFFMIRAYKQGLEQKIDKKILNKTIRNSAIFTIIPSISIFIGVLALSGKLGIPLPWIRLSVIGALHYEGVAANAVYDLATVTMNSEIFVTVAFIMTLGILSGPLYCLFGFKAYDKKVLDKAKVKDNDEVVEVTDNLPKKKPFGPILFNAVFIAIICAFLAADIAILFYSDQKLIDKGITYQKYTPLAVILVSFSCMALFDLLEKKLNWKWLADFSLGLSMIISMAVAVLIG